MSACLSHRHIAHELPKNAGVGRESRSQSQSQSGQKRKKEGKTDVGVQPRGEEEPDHRIPALKKTGAGENDVIEYRITCITRYPVSTGAKMGTAHGGGYGAMQSSGKSREWTVGKRGKKASSRKKPPPYPPGRGMQRCLSTVSAQSQHSHRHRHRHSHSHSHSHSRTRLAAVCSAVSLSVRAGTCLNSLAPGCASR